MNNLTPEQTAWRMHQRYKEQASIHATYNLMQYQRTDIGWAYWSDVLQALRGFGST